jgi:hypothetical protein
LNQQLKYQLALIAAVHFMDGNVISYDEIKPGSPDKLNRVFHKERIGCCFSGLGV